MRIGSQIIFHLKRVWKAKFFTLCDVIFLVRLQGNLKLITKNKPQVAVALAFQQMRTPDASRREICVQEFGNAYQRKRYHFYHRVQQTIQGNKMLFANNARFPLIHSRIFRDRLPHVLFETCGDRVPLCVRTLNASLPQLCVQPDFYA